MRRLRSPEVVLAAAAVVAAAAGPFYAEGPPPGLTGGFNEHTCQTCHRFEPMNAPGGALALDPLPPDGYEPGRNYILAVTVTRPGIGRAGFQLSARFDDGRQAGELALLGRHTALTAHPGSSVQYLQHTKRGTSLAAPDTGRWLFQWQAPSGGTVVFNVAANAANDDQSELGDFIYTREYRLARRP
jgi:hypothetical protein